MTVQPDTVGKTPPEPQPPRKLEVGMFLVGPDTGRASDRKTLWCVATVSKAGKNATLIQYHDGIIVKATMSKADRILGDPDWRLVANPRKAAEALLGAAT